MDSNGHYDLSSATEDFVDLIEYQLLLDPCECDQGNYSDPIEPFLESIFRKFS